MNSVLIVCEGNICRSPMAAAIFAAALPYVSVRSAGLGALVGLPPDPTAMRLMAEVGLDISAHRGTQINRQICLAADLVLVMEQVQRARLENMFPQMRGRIFRLSEHANVDVPDPYRRDEQTFRTALAVIQSGVQEWLQLIRKVQEV